MKFAPVLLAALFLFHFSALASESDPDEIIDNAGLNSMFLEGLVDLPGDEGTDLALRPGETLNEVGPNEASQAPMPINP